MNSEEEIIKLYEENLNPGLARIVKFMGLNSIEVEAQGTKVVDSSGEKYIDCVGGYGSLNFGHRPPKIVAAVKKQLEKMPLSSKLLLNRQQAELAAKLAEVTPGELKFSFACNSGTEAVEGALKLARLYTGKSEIISTVNAFHGKSMGALSATGKEEYKAPFQPLVPGFKHVPFGDIAALAKAVTSRTAAIIVEPIQGEGGIILPPEGYLAEIRKLCNEKEILMIVDEIQTGLGRTGTNFAVEFEKIVPDIMVLAKSLSGGVIPIGALIAKSKVWDPLCESPFLHTSTFGGNPLAAVAGKKALGILKQDKLASRAKELGRKLLIELNKLQIKYSDLIEEVRGRGLMIGIELVTEGIGGMLISELTKRNLLAAYTLNQPKVIRIEPPLVITKEEVDKVVDIFSAAFREVAKMISKEDIC
ncbi:aspartate aminotransferase family protein [Sporohalobacter salinus]|uniref:aspartate aminotransferase family protein n=1 Tax=Sporohalobacter salinus TaxID=1494606 RepID=UPI00195FB94A|nr:aspartate aminotransferase family protein [Sporohalobacter salinus]MBM7623396.1 putrescine aminotransferase [Sporohalobacter salinus]